MAVYLEVFKWISLKWLVACCLSHSEFFLILPDKYLEFIVSKTMMFGQRHLPLSVGKQHFVSWEVKIAAYQAFINSRKQAGSKLHSDGFECKILQHKCCCRNSPQESRKEQQKGVLCIMEKMWAEHVSWIQLWSDTGAAEEGITASVSGLWINSNQSASL